MRIAVVTTSFLPQVGGAEFAVHHLAEQWALQGHDVVVLNNVADRPADAAAGYRVERYPLARGTWRFGYHRLPYVWYESLHLGRALDRIRPDFISAHFGYPTAIWLSRVRPLRRFVITCHGPALDQTEHGPRRRWPIDGPLGRALNCAHRVVAISSHARRVLIDLGVDSERIALIPNGADLGRFREPAMGFDLRARLALPPRARVVLSVGRESWEKAYGDALAAFARVCATAPDAYYVMLGKGTGIWREQAEQSGVAERVRFCEGLYGSELVGAYQQADVFVSSSVSEVCPLVVCEAMAAGLPQVVTDVSGSQDMIRDGENGFVVPPRDVEALAAAIARLLGEPGLRGAMAAAGRERSVEYGWDRLSRRYLELA